MLRQCLCAAWLISSFLCQTIQMTYVAQTFDPCYEPLSVKSTAQVQSAYDMNRLYEGILIYHILEFSSVGKDLCPYDSTERFNKFCVCWILFISVKLSMVIIFRSVQEVLSWRPFYNMKISDQIFPTVLEEITIHISTKSRSNFDSR